MPATLAMPTSVPSSMAHAVDEWLEGRGQADDVGLEAFAHPFEVGPLGDVTPTLMPALAITTSGSPIAAMQAVRRR